MCGLLKVDPAERISLLSILCMPEILELVGDLTSKLDNRSLKMVEG